MIAQLFAQSDGAQFSGILNHLFAAGTRGGRRPRQPEH